MVGDRHGNGYDEAETNLTVLAAFEEQYKKDKGQQFDGACHADQERGQPAAIFKEGVDASSGKEPDEDLHVGMVQFKGKRIGEDVAERNERDRICSGHAAGQQLADEQNVQGHQEQHAYPRKTGTGRGNR